MGYVRFDYLFSYWIAAWFLIYYNIGAFVGPTTNWLKKTANPLLALWIAFWFNVYEIIYVSQIKFDVILIAKYSIMILFLKILPIYLLYRKGLSIDWTNDVFVLAIIFSVYNIHLYVNRQNPSKIYQETEKSLVKGDNKTPMFSLLEKLRKLVQ
uniref:Uncharacterized protein n=1 Tax=viral metagenome TaxID=1070528 RepID=A0A6C0B2R5_9ZZZZ